MVYTNYGILCISFNNDVETSPREEGESNFNFHNDMCCMTFLSEPHINTI